MKIGSPEMVHTAVVKKLNDFPRTEPKDNDKVFHISDILREIEYLKADEWLSDVVCWLNRRISFRKKLTKINIFR